MVVSAEVVTAGTCGSLIPMVDMVLSLLVMGKLLVRTVAEEPAAGKILAPMSADATGGSVTSMEALVSSMAEEAARKSLVLLVDKEATTTGKWWQRSRVRLQRDDGRGGNQTWFSV